MKIDVVRKVTKEKYLYSSVAFPGLVAAAKKDGGGIWLGEIYVRYGEKTLLIKEENLFRSMFHAFYPCFSVKTNWSIYDATGKVGMIKPLFLRPRNKILLYGDSYEIAGHSQGKNSLVKNGAQIAYWEKVAPFYRKCDYEIDCLEMNPLIPFMVCVLYDRMACPGEGQSDLGDTYKTFVPFDDWKERADWRPPNDALPPEQAENITPT